MINTGHGLLQVTGLNRHWPAPRDIPCLLSLLGKYFPFVVVMLGNRNDITHFLCLQLHKSFWTHLVLKVQVVEKEQSVRYAKLWNNVWWLHNTATVELIYWVLLYNDQASPGPCWYQHTVPLQYSHLSKVTNTGQGLLQVTGLNRLHYARKDWKFECYLCKEHFCI